MGFIESLRDKDAKNLQKANKAIESAQDAFNSGDMKCVSEQIDIAKEILLSKEDNEFENYPTFPEYLLKLSSTLLQLERYDDVIAVSDRAINVNRELLKAWHNKFQALLHKELYEEALESIDQAIELDVYNKQLRLDHAIVLSKMGNKDEAVLEAKQLIERNPDYLPIYDLLIEFDDPTLWGTKKAEILMKSGQSVESIQTLDQVLDHSPGDIQAMLLTADVMRKESQYVEASKVYDEVLNISPESVEGNLGKARTLRAFESIEDSIDYYLRALRNDPENLEIKLELASAYELIGTVEKAEALNREVLKKDEKCIEAMEGIYRTTLTQNKWEDVIDISYMLMQYDPAVKYCYSMIDSLVKLQRMDEALEKSESALLSFPDDFGLLIKRKNIAISIGINEETIRYIEAVLEKMPDDLEAMYETGMAYNTIQHYSDAIKILEKLQRIFQKSRKC